MGAKNSDSAQAKIDLVKVNRHFRLSRKARYLIELQKGK
jgi:hypothetical protein